MALADWLPRNSESRALSVAMKMLRRSNPHIQWVVSFADATQCGDGTIYRAAGFALVQIAKNSGLRLDPLTGEVVQAMSAYHRGQVLHSWKAWKPLVGHQLKYIYFLDPTARSRLVGHELPYTAIAAAGAQMYRGERPKHSGDASAYQAEEGGSTPTRTLHNL